MTNVKGGSQPISVADHNLGKTRVLSQQCDTCIFRPGNPMELSPGHLAELVTQARAEQSYIICHDTLPYGNYPDYGPAVCRGFYNSYDTQALQIARRLWGIVEVPPPGGETSAADADADAGHSAAAATVPDVAGRKHASTPTVESANSRPLVFVDVDGVLNPAGSRPEHHGYQPHPFAWRDHDGKSTDSTVWLHPHHGPWLAEIAALGAELVWATSWHQQANTWIAPRLSLPAWPVVDLDGRTGVRFGHALKLDPVTRYAASRPFALIDDQIGGKDHDWALQTTASTLLVKINPHTGLTRRDVDKVLDWLADLPSSSEV